MSCALTWLGHASVVIDLEGTRIVTDPLLRKHAGLLRRHGPVPQPKQYSGARAALISHLHLDHCDPASLRMLPEARVLSGDENAGWLRRHDLPAEALPLNSWRPLAPDVEVMLVEANHHSRPIPLRPSQACGFLLRAGGTVVYFAGDTDLFDGMSTLGERAGGSIDVALLPIAGWGPTLGEGHLDPVRAAEAASMIGAGAVLPIHFGTFHFAGMNLGSLDWMTRPLEEFRTALTESAPQVRLIEAALGEVVSLTPSND